MLDVTAYDVLDVLVVMARQLKQYCSMRCWKVLATILKYLYDILHVDEIKTPWNIIQKALPNQMQMLSHL